MTFNVHATVHGDDLATLKRASGKVNDEVATLAGLRYGPGTLKFHSFSGPLVGKLGWYEGDAVFEEVSPGDEPRFQFFDLLEALSKTRPPDPAPEPEPINAAADAPSPESDAPVESEPDNESPEEEQGVAPPMGDADDVAGPDPPLGSDGQGGESQ